VPNVENKESENDGMIHSPEGSYPKNYSCYQEYEESIFGPICDNCGCCELAHTQEASGCQCGKCKIEEFRATRWNGKQYKEYND